MTPKVNPYGFFITQIQSFDPCTNRPNQVLCMDQAVTVTLSSSFSSIISPIPIMTAPYELDHSVETLRNFFPLKMFCVPPLFRVKSYLGT